MNIYAAHRRHIKHLTRKYAAISNCEEHIGVFGFQAFPHFGYAQCLWLIHLYTTFKRKLLYGREHDLIASSFRLVGSCNDKTHFMTGIKHCLKHSRRNLGSSEKHYFQLSKSSGSSILSALSMYSIPSR